MNTMKDNYNHLFEGFEQLISSPVPNFKKIESEIEKIPPAAISMKIQEDVAFTFLLDYYFRYIDSKIVKKILQNPMFTPEALAELFYCQIASIYKSVLNKKEKPELFSSYWKILSNAEYAILFKYVLSKTTNLDIAKPLLQKIDLVHLKLMTSNGEIKSEKILSLFKKLGNELQKVIAKDMNIYDFIFDLAVDNSDQEFLSFLEEYTTLFVQIRLASSFVEDVENLVKKQGRNLSYTEIHQICSNIPPDSLKVALQIFQDKGWITESENKSIDEHYLKSSSS
ncbi:MAG: hypothetical protein L6Q54_05940 [Leptospiraceae bacterium]|nr:hypothetical protein [Leptospiraceae bacterium]MCK6380776.1 hypothetical protein [Leptospiraceae bacterium]NUM41621.1 hypothetical protein [Leptospiraceae bacterium]